MNSKQKGKRGELEAASFLRELGFPETRRTAQYCGNTGRADDIIGVEGLHIEVKRCEQVRIMDWLEQAERDSAEGAIPVVMFRRSREPWYVCLPAKDFFKEYDQILRTRNLTN